MRRSFAARKEMVPTSLVLLADAGMDFPSHIVTCTEVANGIVLDGLERGT